MVWGEKMIEYFKDLKDARQSGKVEHNLVEIIMMTIFAMMAACDYWEEIEDYCETKIEWFKNELGLELKNGIPSHDTFQRVFQSVNPKELQRCFVEWVRSIHATTNGEIVSIDGKTVRGSKSNKKKAIHMVSAWSSANNLVLGQTKVDTKSNEITAIPTLLDMLEIKGCIVTIDAMGCQKKIAKKIVKDNEADYIFGLKGNQEKLETCAEQAFDNAENIDEVTTENEGHGRLEERKYELTESKLSEEMSIEWVGLRSFGKVTTHVIEKGKESVEVRLFATSLTSVDSFAEAVRGHWGVENGLHWTLDVAFREDKNKTWAKNSAENLAVARHVAVNVLKHVPIKMSLERKRKKCAYDEIFLSKVLKTL
jgi:predicted transposase YbfD/YdcC